jgi:hypothetical protein
MTVTVDLTLCKHALEMAEAAGFPDSLPLDERARLGFALNDDDDLAAEIERNWLIECRAGGGQTTHPQVIVIATIKTLPNHDLVLYRNRALAHVAAEKKLAQNTSQS